MSTTVFITGANGEIGHGLIHYLSDQDNVQIVALDLHSIDPEIAKRCTQTIVGDILDPSVLQRVSSGSEFSVIYHLAALLSTRSEKEPLLAHRVNVDGMLNILELANTQSEVQGRSVMVLYPSSIAVYGMPSLEAKRLASPVRETDWCQPRTMYGINKLYCEHLGTYYSDHYRQLDMALSGPRVDVRPWAAIPSGNAVGGAPAGCGEIAAHIQVRAGLCGLFRSVLEIKAKHSGTVYETRVLCMFEAL